MENTETVRAALRAIGCSYDSLGQSGRFSIHAPSKSPQWFAEINRALEQAGATGNLQAAQVRGYYVFVPSK